MLRETEIMANGDWQVPGFKAGAVRAGIRGKDRLDVGLICSEVPATAAGVFTTSEVKAAPVILGQEHLAHGRAQAIFVNSGVANACTGKEGMELARRTATLVADKLALAPELIQVSSTGVIGEQLDFALFENCLPELTSSLDPDGLSRVARAMMTTDTVPKICQRTLKIDGGQVTICGMAKGAGMIMPNMATMLGFVMTDAAVAPAVLQDLLTGGVAQSFNAITEDGDTSTNDTVLLLANGVAGNQEIDDSSSAEAIAFGQCLNQVLLELALAIVRDGEGASKLITVEVRGCPGDIEADQAARTIANSNLVKTACFGEDANWGRIIAALGRSGFAFDQSLVEIAFDGVVMVENGLGLGVDQEELATAVLKKDEFTIMVDLHQGSGQAKIYTCDFSLDYVRINADYRT